MFDEKNKTFSQVKMTPKEINVDELPLRTMASDIKNKENPAFNEEIFLADDKHSPEKNIPIGNLSEKQKSSPFLNQEKNAADNNPAREPQIRINTQTVIQPEPDKAKESPESGLHFGKMLFISLVIFAVLAGVGASYYFLMLRNSQEPASEITLPDESLSDQSAATTDQTADQNQEAASQNDETSGVSTTLNQDKPNLLVIDSAKNTKADVQKSIQDKMTEIVKEQIATPVEFTPVNTQFVPLSFLNFAETLDINLSDAVKQSLGSDFSLYLYQKEGQASGLALVIKTTDYSKLTLAMSQEEPTLVKDIDILFLGTPYTVIKNEFFTNSYKGVTLRFQNLSSDSFLATDYAVFNNQLLLATSKDAALSLIDFLKK